MSGTANERKGLSPSARALLDAARDSDAPTTADRERVRRALGVAIAASAGTAGAVSAATSAKAIASTASSASAAGASAVGGGAVGGGGAVAASGAGAAVGAGVLTKVAIAVVAISVGSSAVVAVHHRYASAPTQVVATVDAIDAPAAAPRVDRVAVDGVSAPVEALPVEAPAAEAATAEAIPVEAVVEAPPAELAIASHPMVVVPTAAPRRARALPAAHDDAPLPAAIDDGSLTVEMGVLRDSSLPGVSPDRRLESVDAHAARFPDGQLAAERDRARRRAVHDLCAQGGQAALRYIASHPGSSSAALIRETCPDEAP